MIAFDQFLQRPWVQPHRPALETALRKRTDPARHGDLPKWLQAISELPELATAQIELDRSAIRVQGHEPLSQQDSEALENALKKLMPWRKGPYQVFDTFIDTEWRSDFKWERVAPHLADLQHKTVLDIGCGNGYHGWRMLGAGADYVLGIDPSVKFLTQFLAINHYIKCREFDLLPLGIEDLPSPFYQFDTVFSMGVLYHRKEPQAHARQLFELTKLGGQVVLETLIVDNNVAIDGFFKPNGRYAQMRNVWQLTTAEKSIELLRNAGYVDARCIDINITQTSEQRQTEWMQFHSLQQFLHPVNKEVTIEGHPAPKRAIFIAEKR